MGIFDRFRRVNLRGIRKTIEQQLPAAKAAPRVELDLAKQDTWAPTFIKEYDLQGEFEDFQADAKDLADDIELSLGKFTDEGVLQAIPERARTINELHGHELADQTRKLLKRAAFTGLYAAEDEIAQFLAAKQEYQDLTNKNASALREFMHDELKATQELLQKLEDRAIGMARLLEERKFPLIRQVRDAHEALAGMEERRGKYQQLAAALEEDRTRTQDRLARIEEKIREQQGLIRNEEAHIALEQLRSIEDELAKATMQYGTLAQDALKHYRKYPQLEPPRAAKRTVEELGKDHVRVLADTPLQVRDAFIALAEHLRESPGSTRGLADRLERLAERVDADAQLAKESIARQRTLRQAVLRDVAAIAIYDQQQFLLRARHDLAEIDRKLAFIATETDPAKRIGHERAMKDAALALGATIRGEKAPASSPDEESPDAASSGDESDGPEPDDGPEVAHDDDKRPDETAPEPKA